MNLKKFKIISFAKLQALLTGLLGLVSGLLYSFGGLVVDTMVSIGLIFPVSYEASGLSYGTILAFGAVVGMPILFALFGFVLGLLEAFLFNVYVSWFGAIKVDFWQ